MLTENGLKSNDSCRSRSSCSNRTVNIIVRVMFEKNVIKLNLNINYIQCHSLFYMSFFILFLNITFFLFNGRLKKIEFIDCHVEII